MNGQTERADDEVELEQQEAAADAAAAEATDSEQAVEEQDADPLAEAEAKAAENWDKYVRAAAELDNVRKRAARDVDNARKFALERFAADLLAVKDSMEMGLESAASADATQLRDGTEATLKLLATTLERFGISEVDPLGAPFDPEQHEAMTMQPSADAEPGSVLTVFQKGYLLNGRLLRPARVIVAQEMPVTDENGEKTD